MQSHKFRSEHWVVVSGEATVRLASEDFKLKKNESIWDLALVGLPKAQILVYKGSHSLNALLASSLKN